jgi:hypothetical protein
VSFQEEIGPLVRSIAVPPQANDPDITVVAVDLHESGFVVRCVVGEGATLRPSIAALDLYDSQWNSYSGIGHGEDFNFYKPAIPAGTDWLKIRTVPETHIVLSDSGRTPTVGPPCPHCSHPQTEGPGQRVSEEDSLPLFEWRCPNCGRTHTAQDPRDLR